MKVDLNINTQELAQEITQAVICALQPLLKNNAGDDTIFDVKKLAGYLNVTPKWIYERTHLKEIPHYKITGRLMFKKNDIDKWFATQKVPAISAPARKFQVIKRK